MLQWFYLHGLASGPKSRKAQLLGAFLQERGQTLHRIDFNDGGFSHLTVSRQIRQVSARIAQEERVVLIGSSLGGLTAAWVAQESLMVERLVLLAPAFGFPDCWLTAGELEEWRRLGDRLIYHYGQGRSLPLRYHFVEDARTWLPHRLTRPVPTTIIHGRQDEVIPIQSSRDYAKTRSWVELIEVDSDHALGQLHPRVWQEVIGERRQ